MAGLVLVGRDVSGAFFSDVIARLLAVSSFFRIQNFFLKLLLLTRVIYDRVGEREREKEREKKKAVNSIALTRLSGAIGLGKLLQPQILFIAHLSAAAEQNGPSNTQ